MPRGKRATFFRELAAKRWKIDENKAMADSPQLNGTWAQEQNEVVDTLESPASNTNILHSSIGKTIRISKKFDLLADKKYDDLQPQNECKYILLDVSQLSTILTKTKCADCNESSLRLNLSGEKHGFAHKIILNCENCGLIGLESEKSRIHTSKRIENSDSERPRFDVNLRLSTAFTYMGKGYAAIEQFAMIMNMQLFSESSFDDCQKILEIGIDKSTQIILDECRLLAKEAHKKLISEQIRNDENSEGELSETENAEEFQNENSEANQPDNNCQNSGNDEVTNENERVAGNSEKNCDDVERRDEEKNACLNIGVSYDGSWPTRGHKSKHGFGSVIDLLSGFVLDFEIVSKFCQACAYAVNELGEDSPDFFFWSEGHASQCPINHSGSSGAMETSVAEIIWKRSVNYGYRFTTMLSDGDAKTFNHLSTLNIYGSEYQLTKEECINHVGKRLYNGITTVVKEEKSRKVTLGGKKHGQLKEATIKKLAAYYKKAIYRNKGDIQAMKDAIYASIYHAVSTDEDPQHSKCPQGSSSWCFYQSAIAKHKLPGSHKENVRTPLNKLCFEKLVPLYERLTDEALLRRCARCLTQNANESLHSVVWSKCAKEVFTSKSRVKSAASIAVSEYNLGVKRSVAEILKQVSLEMGQNTLLISRKIDDRKLKRGVQKKSEAFQNARRIIASAESRREKVFLESEGVMYGAGMF